MIYSLKGTILEKSVTQVVIECAGVGYLVGIPQTAAGALPAAGEEATLYTHMNVTDSDVSLFGFADRENRAMFTLLTGVSGVGPRVALAVLSALPPDRIALAVSAGDYKALTAANGVGPKLAQRLVLELKDKVAGFGAGGGLTMEDVQTTSGTGAAGNTAQAVAALAGLGYTQSEAAAAVAKIDAALPVPEIIRLALRGMGGR